MACINVSSAQMSCLQTVTRCYIISFSLHVRRNDFNHTFQSKSFVSAPKISWPLFYLNFKFVYVFPVL